MMTITKDSMLTKVATGVVAFTAGILMLGMAQPAAAQSNAELEAQIQSLLETIASLQAQVDGGSSATIAGCDASIWLNDLSVGSQGQDVQNVQTFLNSIDGIQVAASGPGSPGNETTYYGSLTAAAVSDFQEKYSSEILAPLSLTSGTGYWGAGSRSTARQLCEQGADDDSDDSDDDSDDSDDDSADLEGGEASLEDYDFDNGPDGEVTEGSSAEVAEVEFDVENGDVKVSRIDVSLQRSAGSGDIDPWDVFESVNIIVDGDEVASMNADDENDYLDDDADSNGYFELRFSDMDWVVREGDTAEFTIEVETQNNVDDAGNAQWDILIQEDDIRVIDGEGINHYLPESGDVGTAETFDIDEVGDDDDLEVNTSSNDPDASTIEVDEDDREGWFDIFVFELSADDSDNDIAIDTIPVTIEIASGSSDDIGDVINDLELVIDGETFDDYSLSTTTGTSTIATFDIDEDYTLDAGDEVDVALGVEFEAQVGNYSSGETIRASVSSTDDNTSDDGDIDGEGADDIVAAGSATGEWHTLLSSGIFAYDASTDTSTEGDDAGTTGVFSINFTLEAFEGDFYFDNDGEGIGYTINPQGSATTTYTSETYALQDTSGADEESGSFIVREGESEDFEFEVYLDPAAAGSYNVQLDDIDYGTTSSATSSSNYDFSPSSDYKTSNQFISNS